MVISQSGTVEETNHYYPFGGIFAATNNVQPYKYNGKELDTKNGLNWYDYGARHYDAALGRFVSVDPLAEQDYAVSPYTYCGNNPVLRIEQDYAVSPYTYCGNNPVLRIDKDGRIWETVWDVGNMLYDAGAAVAAHLRGDHVSAQSHWVDLGLDAAAAIVPFVPAGATKALKAANQGVDAVKAAKQVDKAADASKSGARFIGDVDGKLIDTHATPKGTYVQPNGAETDVLGREHLNKIGGGKVESLGTSHTHNQGKNIDKKGIVHTFREDKAHIPTYEEIQNIQKGIAIKKKK